MSRHLRCHLLRCPDQRYEFCDYSNPSLVQRYLHPLALLLDLKLCHFHVLYQLCDRPQLMQQSLHHSLPFWQKFREHALQSLADLEHRLHPLGSRRSIPFEQQLVDSPSCWHLLNSRILNYLVLTTLFQHPSKYQLVAAKYPRGQIQNQMS